MKMTGKDWIFAGFGVCITLIFVIIVVLDGVKPASTKDKEKKATETIVTETAPRTFYRGESSIEDILYYIKSKNIYTGKEGEGIALGLQEVKSDGTLKDVQLVYVKPEVAEKLGHKEYLLGEKYSEDIWIETHGEYYKVNGLAAYIMPWESKPKILEEARKAYVKENRDNRYTLNSTNKAKEKPSELYPISE